MIRTSDKAALVVCAGVIVGWAFVLRKLGGDDVYAYLGPYSALVIIAASVHAYLRRTAHTQEPRMALATNIALGVGVGVAMTIGTFVAYRIFSAASPALAIHVEALYRATRTTSIEVRLAWTAVVIVAEEMLWRGALFSAAERVFGTYAAIAVSLLAYTAVQVGTGSWVVPLTAFVCGAFWTAERVVTRSLVAPLISHTIWTMIVIHLYPVTRL